MNFFEHQHQARRKTWLLVTYFLLAVALIVLAVNLAVFAAYYLTLGTETADQITSLQSWVQGPYAFGITAATLAVIVLGTLSTLVKLRSGGRAVAQMVGARKVDTNSGDLDERQLINIVEEMSIASGTPVPELYVLEDEAINAFVAGYRPTEAVLVVTRGALENFSRDELQGVIGHEYSHVFNGDMRLNIRLMGILAGILLIGQIGRFLLRSSGRSSNKKGGGLVFLGLALLLVGYIGLFFGSLIKAAISRQREFLADASSVQFTRNPGGIAGALWTIKENAAGSRLLNAHAEDISHFCFSDAIGTKFTSMLATHPPLDERIQAIDPHFDLKKRVRRRQERDTAAAAPSHVGAVAAPAAGMAFAGATTTAAAVSGAGISATVGQTQARHLDHAVLTHAAIPAPLARAVHEQHNVRQVIYALILADTPAAYQQSALALLPQAGIGAVNDFCAQLLPSGGQFRLALINIAIPVLKTLSAEERAAFLETLESLIKADRRYTIFEFALLAILREHLNDDAGRDVKVKYYKYAEVLPEVSLLLSLLARIGARDEASARSTYATIIRHFTPGAAPLADMSDCKLSAVGTALRKLNHLSPRLKQTLIESFADCVIHDGQVLPVEAEMLQAIAISLDCPLPPLLTPVAVA